MSLINYLKNSINKLCMIIKFINLNLLKEYFGHISNEYFTERVLKM